MIAYQDEDELPVLDREYVMAHPHDSLTAGLWRLVTARTGLTLRVITNTAYLVKVSEYGFVELHRMMVNWRLVADDRMNWRAWCFLGPQALFAALDAVQCWDGQGDPPGPWYKAVHTGELRREHMYLPDGAVAPLSAWELSTR
jgi:hypothetical protein